MPILARVVSPDGLVFLVTNDDDGVILGFEDAGWHLHAEDLLHFDGDAPKAALRVVDDLIENRLVMIREIGPDGAFWALLWDIAFGHKHLPDGEALVLRTWDGAVVAADDLLSGKRPYISVR